MRRLKATLSDYNDSLRSILRPSSAVRVVDMQRAVAPTLPFAMLPLRLALVPAKSAPSGFPYGEGGSTLDGKQMGPPMAKGIAEGKMPAEVREKALLCITAAIRGSGVRFVEVRRTILLYSWVSESADTFDQPSLSFSIESRCPSSRRSARQRSLLQFFLAQQSALQAHQKIPILCSARHGHSSHPTCRDRTVFSCTPT